MASEAPAPAPPPPALETVLWSWMVRAPAQSTRPGTAAGLTPDTSFMLPAGREQSLNPVEADGPGGGEGDQWLIGSKAGQTETRGPIHILTVHCIDRHHYHHHKVKSFLDTHFLFFFITCL